MYLFICHVSFFCLGKLLMDDDLFSNSTIADIFFLTVLWIYNQIVISILLSGFISSSGAASAIGYIISLFITLIASIVNINIYSPPGRLPFYYKLFPSFLFQRQLLLIILKSKNNITSNELRDYYFNIFIFIFNSALYSFLGFLLNE